MTHIPPHKILPQDMVDMHDHGPGPSARPKLKDDADVAAVEAHEEALKHFEAEVARFKIPATVRMHASDARHAMDVDPERWTLAGDLPAHKQPKAEAEPRKTRKINND